MASFYGCTSSIKYDQDPKAWWQSFGLTPQSREIFGKTYPETASNPFAHDNRAAQDVVDPTS